MEKITYAFSKLKGVDPSYYIDAYNLVLQCSATRTPRDFADKLLSLIAKVCPYDQAIAFFFDRNFKIAGLHSIGTKKGWVETYLNYYIEFAGPHDMSKYEPENAVTTKSSIIDWDLVPSSEFKDHYIDPVNLKYTWSFSFFGMDGVPRITICLDRRHKEPYKEEEQQTLRLALPILNNMYRYFFYKESDNVDTASLWKEYRLTSRETQIADMMCQGMKASQISNVLVISEGTTNKHIAHIYKKVGVKSHQELIARMLSRRALV